MSLEWLLLLLGVWWISYKLISVPANKWIWSIAKQYRGQSDEWRDLYYAQKTDFLRLMSVFTESVMNCFTRMDRHTLTVKDGDVEIRVGSDDHMVDLDMEKWREEGPVTAIHDAYGRWMEGWEDGEWEDGEWEVS